MRQDKASIMIRSIIGSNIRDLRLAQGASQAALAKDAGIDRSYLGRVEKGRENPSLTILAKIADSLHVPLTDLFKGLEDCPPRRLPERYFEYGVTSFPPPGPTRKQR